MTLRHNSGIDNRQHLKNCEIKLVKILSLKKKENILEINNLSLIHLVAVEVTLIVFAVKFSLIILKQQRLIRASDVFEANLGLINCCHAQNRNSWNSCFLSKQNNRTLQLTLSSITQFVLSSLVLNLPLLCIEISDYLIVILN